MNEQRKLNPINVSIFLASMVLVFASFKFMKVILIPVFIAFLFQVVTEPISDKVKKKWSISKINSSLVLLFFSIGVFITLGYIYYLSLQSLVSEGGLYLKKLEKFVAPIIIEIKSEFPHVNLTETLREELRTPLKAILSYSSSIFQSSFEVISLSIISALFLITSPPKFNSVFSQKSYHPFKKSIRKYIFIKTMTSVATAIIIATYLKLIGTDLIFFAAISTFLLNYIPSLGSIASTLILAPIILLAPSIDSQSFLLMIPPAITHFIIGNIIEPKLMGDALRLNPIIVITALVFWGGILGGYGLFLAIPLTLSAKLISKLFDFDILFCAES